MNLGLSEALVLSGQAERSAEKIKHLDVVLCPSAPFIYPVFEHLKARPSNLYLGLQNFYCENEGPFTGEVSLEAVRGVCRFVIIGHSERRKIFGESDELIAKKVRCALSGNMDAIICVGEQERFHLEDHYGSEVERMNKQGGVLVQIDRALEKVTKSQLANVIIAYEPIWAIGTGNAANGAYAAAICYIIENHLKKRYGESAQDVRILYGGSVSAADTKEFMMQPSIHGLLVGGASLKAVEFAKICQISAEVNSGRLV